MVAAAAHTMIFCAWPDQFKVPLGGERVRYRREKTRPARAAIKLHRRRKQRQTAASADEHSRTLLIVEWAREGTLGAFPAQYVKLFGREHLLPLRFGAFERFGGEYHVGGFRQIHLPILL